MPDKDIDYIPYFSFNQTAFGQGFDEVKIKADRAMVVILRNDFPQEDDDLYIDGKRQEIPPE
jgi:hypothetical protein